MRRHQAAAAGIGKGTGAKTVKANIRRFNAQSRKMPEAAGFWKTAEERLAEQTRDLIFREEARRAKVTLIMISIFRGEQRVAFHPEGRPTSKRCMQLMDKVDKEYEYITFADAARFMNFTEPYLNKKTNSIWAGTITASVIMTWLCIFAAGMNFQISVNCPAVFPAGQLCMRNWQREALAEGKAGAASQNNARQRNPSGEPGTPLRRFFPG